MGHAEVEREKGEEMSTFCPGDISQLLEIYTKGEPQLNALFVKHLLLKDLIRAQRHGLGLDTSSYEVTERGLALIEHIKNLPLPECKWSMPQ